ncbi:MAG: thioredoxin-disulfide reductase [Ruminiclostridium sp.]|nr:thioredoxin-disulfide reductase [Ruminiclostridium sp.]
MYDIIVIGAGPAGLTAAIYARRASKTVLVLEAMTYGGQIINTPDIENYPAAPHISGLDFANRLYEQATGLGAEVVFERVTEIKDGTEKTVVTAENTYTAKAVIIATGSQNRKLGIEGERELVGRGVSYCATCDGAFFRNKKVAVMGGGNTALEDALYLADLAETVYLIHRRGEFRGDEATVNALKERQNIKFVLNSTVTKLIADKRLTAIEVTDKNTGAVTKLDVNGLFVAIGRTPENQPFEDLIKLDEAGYIAAGEDCITNVPGIFAAGDNRTKSLRQLVTAAADGAAAATAAVQYISR